MSGCIVNFGGTVKIFRCSELESERLSKLMNTELDAIIKYYDVDIEVRFDLEDIKKCSKMVRDLNSDADHPVSGASPKSMSDALLELEDSGLKSGIFSLFLLIHSTSRYKDKLSKELRERIMEYLILNCDVSLELADYLNIEEIINHLLLHNVQPCQMNRIIHNHTLNCWQTVECMSRGVLIKFDGIIDRIQDIAVFEKALDFGMQITEIYDGSYLTNDLLLKCTDLKVLNLDSNPYVTGLGECVNTLEELHCCKSSGIRQRCIDRCSNLKHLHINDNPYITRCNYQAIVTLSIRGTCGLPKAALLKCSNLRELYIDFDRDMSWLPRWVTKLHVYNSFRSDFDSNNIPDYTQLEYLEVEDLTIFGLVGPNLKTFICTHLPDGKVDYNVASDIMSQAVNIEKLVAPFGGLFRIELMPKLKHLEMLSINPDLIVNPEKLEILKCSFYDGTTEHGLLNRDRVVYIDNDLRDGHDIPPHRSVQVYSFDKFTRLHTVHLEGNICVKLSEDSSIRDLKCRTVTGSIHGLKRLSTDIYGFPSGHWMPEQKTSIEYLYTRERLKDISDYSRIKEYEYKIDDTRSDVALASMNGFVISKYSKYAPPPNPYDIFDNSLEHLILLLNLTKLSRQYVRSDIFSNIRTLSVSSTTDYYLYCGHFPMLEDLTVDGSTGLCCLEEMTKLKSLNIHMKHIERRLEYSNPHLKGVGVPEVVDGHDICITNPLLQSVKICSIGKCSAKKLSIESLWLKSLEICKDTGRTDGLESLAISSRLENLTTYNCHRIEIIGNDRFESLITYTGDILIDFEGSLRTLKKINIPKLPNASNMQFDIIYDHLILFTSDRWLGRIPNPTDRTCFNNSGRPTIDTVDIGGRIPLRYCMALEDLRSIQ